MQLLKYRPNKESEWKEIATIMGPPGPAPIKGTDYWTEADKQEIINSVLAALPAAEGVSV